MRKRLLIVAFLLAAVFAFSGCGEVVTLKKPVKLSYYDYTTGDKDYNDNLFYRNDLTLRSADPSGIYITEGDEKGYFYMYATSDMIGCRGIMAWRSTDLNTWQNMGVVFTPDQESWGKSSIWAPEIIYDKTDQTYYLFYSAHNGNQTDGYTAMKYLGLCTSKSPAGPFVQWTGENANGDTLTVGDPIFDLEKMDHDNPLYKKDTGFIDAAPFIDPVTGDKYLYMCRARYTASTNEIWGVKLIDWATPDYSTVTRLTRVNKTTIDGDEDTDLTAGVIDEGPYVLYAHGKYYLTFSINGTTDKNYAVCQAIGDSPLGPFTKVQNADGGLILGAEMTWDHVSCAGHHSFIEMEDELWIIYHQDIDREIGGTMVRGIAVDRVEWTQNSKNQYVLQAVGPTNSVQALPKTVSGYRNVALDATITSDNTKAGSDVKYLNDGLVRTHEISVISDFETNEGITKVTLTFNDYVTTRAIMVYNSWDYEKAFVKIARIDLDFKTQKDKKTLRGTAYAENIEYDFDTYANINYEMMRAGAAAIIEYDDLLVKKITLTFATPSGYDGIAIPEIVVLGK